VYICIYVRTYIAITLWCITLCLVNRVDEHNHHPDDKAAIRGVILKKIRAKVSSNPTVPVRRVFDDVVDEEICSDSDELPEWECAYSGKTHECRILAAIASNY